MNISPNTITDERGQFGPDERDRMREVAGVVIERSDIIPPQMPENAGTSQQAWDVAREVVEHCNDVHPTQERLFTIVQDTYNASVISFQAACDITRAMIVIQEYVEKSRQDAIHKAHMKLVIFPHKD